LVASGQDDATWAIVGETGVAGARSFRRSDERKDSRLDRLRETIPGRHHAVGTTVGTSPG